MNGADRDRTGDPLLAKPSQGVGRRQPSLMFLELAPCPAHQRWPVLVGSVRGSIPAAVRATLAPEPPEPGDGQRRQRSSSESGNPPPAGAS
jgi:hypothetical protein